MGMTLVFYALTQKNMDELIDHPKQLPAFMHTNEKDQKRRASMTPEQYEKFMREHREFEQRMAKQFNNPWIAYEPRKKGYKSLFQIDLEKSWHGIHFLLTGQSGDKGWLSWLPFAGGGAVNSPIFGGKKIGDGGDMEGNRFFTPKEVRVLHAALTSRSIEAWGKNYNAEKMHQANIYPDVWQREGQSAYDGFLLPNLQGLITFFEEAAGQNLAVFKVMG